MCCTVSGESIGDGDSPCLKEGVCVTGLYGRVQTYIPILRFRHALKSLKLSWSMGSNCGLNSSYFFPHRYTRRGERDFKFHIQQGQAVYITYLDCGIQIIHQTLTKRLMWPISFDSQTVSKCPPARLRHKALLESATFRMCCCKWWVECFNTATDGVQRG